METEGQPSKRGWTVDDHTDQVERGTRHESRDHLAGNPSGSGYDIAA
jgi:hypothetical protein